MPAASLDTYWASRDSVECVRALFDRVGRYQKHLTDSGRAERMNRSWSAYYGYGVDGQKSTNRLMQGGEQGEVILMATPLYATLMRQVERLLTGQKPAYKTRATNSDSGAIVEAMLGDQLLDYYDRASALPQREAEAVRSGLLLSAGYEVLSWDTAQGEVTAVDPNTGKEYRQGDVDVRYCTPWDVAFDFRDPDEEKRQWVAFRYRAKRFDLIAQFPECKDELMKGAGEQSTNLASDELVSRMFRDASTSSDEDNIWVWELRHKRTAALPSGRIVRCVNDKCILFDSAAVKTPATEGRPAVLNEETGEEESPETYGEPEGTQNAGYPYPDLLVYEFNPETVLGTAAGHTSSFDILGICEAIEAMDTAGMTNINMGAVTNLWTPDNASPNIERLSTGANLVKSAVKPEAIDLVSISPAMMEFRAMVKASAQEALGLNDVVMGETPKGMPAQLAALLEAKAIQYHQQGQAAYYRLVERSRTGLLKLLQRFAAEPRVTELVGKANAWAQKEWSAESIGRITKVVVEPVNPMMKTFAGRMNMVDMLGADIGTAQGDAKMSLMLTGSVEEKLDGPKAHMGRIAREKEMLRQGIGMPPVDIEASQAAGAPVFVPAEGGQSIQPLISDRHWIDIPEYLTVLESPEARANEKVVTAVLDLVTEKQRLWAMMPLDLIVVLGGQPAPSTMMAMGAPPMPPDDKGKPPGEKPPAMPPAEDGVPGGAPVKLPKPPPNPLSGEQNAPPMGIQ